MNSPQRYSSSKKESCPFFVQHPKVSRIGPMYVTLSQVINISSKDSFSNRTLGALDFRRNSLQAERKGYFEWCPSQIPRPICVRSTSRISYQGNTFRKTYVGVANSCKRVIFKAPACWYGACYFGTDGNQRWGRNCGPQHLVRRNTN